VTMYTTLDKKSRRESLRQQCAVDEQKSLWVRRMLLRLIDEHQDDERLRERLKLLFAVMAADRPRFRLQRAAVSKKT